MPGNEEEAGSSSLIWVLPGEQFQNSWMLWGTGCGALLTGT